VPGVEELNVHVDRAEVPRLRLLGLQDIVRLLGEVLAVVRLTVPENPLTLVTLIVD